MERMNGLVISIGLGIGLFMWIGLHGDAGSLAIGVVGLLGGRAVLNRGHPDPLGPDIAWERARGPEEMPSSDRC